MGALDIIPVPGHPGMFNRRAAVEAWQRAGSPDVTYGGRLYGEQKRLYDLFRAGKGSPADNPDATWMPLAHCRFAAWDIRGITPTIRARLIRAGFIFPYSYEGWHCELPNVKQYAIVHTIPSTSGEAVKPLPKPTPAPTPAPAPTTRKATPVTLYRNDSTTPYTYALAGDSPGTPANWLVTTRADLARDWAAVHGSAVPLDGPTFTAFAARYEAPLSVKS